MIGTDGSRQKLRHEQNGAMLMCLGQKASIRYVLISFDVVKNEPFLFYECVTNILFFE